ncbi:MAG: hypothetical protein HYX69_15740 [Planctomycetia bacterium]|nr:hypothetical protein [Planctomycetia bacterium]
MSVLLGLAASRGGLAVASAEDAAGEVPQPRTATLPPEEYLALVQDAEKQFRAFNYEQALPLYRRLVEVNPYHQPSWNRLARCEERTEHYDRAIAAYEKLIELGFDAAGGHNEYQIARMYAQSHDGERTMDWLERALAARHEHSNVMRTDPRFEFLRDDPRFIRLAALPVDADKVDRGEKWRRDLDHLLREAARMHVQWREGDRAARFTEAVQTIRAKVADLTDGDILAEIQKALVLLGDGHTRPHFGGRKTLPLRLYFFSDGLFVIDAAEPYRDLIGCRVERLGGADIERLKQLLATVESRDNPMGIIWLGPFELVKPWLLKSLGLMPAEGPLSLDVVDRAGKTRTVAIEPADGPRYNGDLPPSRLADAPPPPRYMSKMETAYWFEPLPDAEALYFQFNSVGGQKGDTLDRFADRLQAQFESQRPKAVIVDLRHNGGGDTYLYLNLLKTLIHYERDNPQARYYALVGRGTFSAAQNFTNDLDRLTEAVFVGEPTGSRPKAAGESTGVVLPYSGAALSISTRYHQHAYPTDSRIWVAPDFRVELSSEDYFANRDPALDAVLAFVRAQTTAAKSAASGP